MSQFKIFIQNNYLIIQCDNPTYTKQSLAKNILIQPVDSNNPVEYDFFNFDNQRTKWDTIMLADMVDENDVAYDYNTWTAFYTANTGQFGSPSSSGGATEATLSALNAKTPTQGQKTMANSSPVVIASDQSTLPVSASTLPLPSGASTSALQTSGNTLLGTLVNTQNFGTISVGISAPTLPHTIIGGVYNSYTIITAGSVAISGVTVPVGTYRFACGSNEYLTSLTLTDVSGGSVVILLQEK